MDFLIDTKGSLRDVENRDPDAAVSQRGWIEVLVHDWLELERAAVDRTIIVKLEPRLVGDLAFVGLGNALSEFAPDRVVLIEIGRARCWVFSDCLEAMQTVSGLREGRGPPTNDSASSPCETPAAVGFV